MARRKKKAKLRYTHPALEPVVFPHLFKDNPMAKKKVKKKVARSSKKTPAPGQKALPGVEDDRDADLDRQAVVVAEAKNKVNQANDALETACVEMENRMRGKKRKSYTSAGLNFNTSEKHYLKITKAKE